MRRIAHPRVAARIATGELDLPVVDHSNNSKHKGILGPFLVSELCKKMNNPKKMDSLMSFLARIAESSRPSVLKEILSSLGLAGSHYALRRSRKKALLFDPGAVGADVCVLDRRLHRRAAGPDRRLLLWPRRAAHGRYLHCALVGELLFCSLYIYILYILEQQY